MNIQEIVLNEIKNAIEQTAERKTMQNVFAHIDFDYIDNQVTNFIKLELNKNGITEE